MTTNKSQKRRMNLSVMFLSHKQRMKRAGHELRRFNEVDRWDSTNEDILFSFGDIWMNVIKMLVYSISPTSTNIVKIFMVTFNSGKLGRQTKTWSPTQFFPILCEIDVTVNVRQIVKTLVHTILFIADLHTPAADHTLFQRTKQVSKAFPKTYDCLCSQDGATTNSRQTYLQCSKFADKGNRCCASKISRTSCSKGETPDQLCTA